MFLWVKQYSNILRYSRYFSYAKGKFYTSFSERIESESKERTKILKRICSEWTSANLFIFIGLLPFQHIKQRFRGFTLVTSLDGVPLSCLLYRFCLWIQFSMFLIHISRECTQDRYLILVQHFSIEKYDTISWRVLFKHLYYLLHPESSGDIYTIRRRFNMKIESNLQIMIACKQFL